MKRGAETVSDAILPPERIVATINLVRLAVERAGLDVLQLAQRSVGLQGFLRGHPWNASRAISRPTCASPLPMAP